MGAGTKTKKGKHSKKSRKTISFEEEVVTRDEASKYLKEESLNRAENNLENINEVGCNSTKNKSSNVQEFGTDIELRNGQDTSEKKAKKQKRSKRKGQSSNTEILEESTAVSESEPPKKKKKHKKKTSFEESGKLDHSADLQSGNEDSQSPGKHIKLEDEPHPDTADTDAKDTVKKAQEKSKRLQKREKHQMLLEEKKLKHELHLQQKALEYLSRWKHSRGTWRFEKLKQIWLQQNLFESSKIPSEFWDSVLEYFTSARGKVKSVLIEKAIKIVNENKSEMQKEDDNEDEQNSGETIKSEESENNPIAVKVQRARDIVQYLQEE